MLSLASWMEVAESYGREGSKGKIDNFYSLFSIRIILVRKIKIRYKVVCYYYVLATHRIDQSTGVVGVNDITESEPDETYEITNVENYQDKADCFEKVAHVQEKLNVCLIPVHVISIKIRIVLNFSLGSLLHYFLGLLHQNWNTKYFDALNHSTYFDEEKEKN